MLRSVLKTPVSFSLRGPVSRLALHPATVQAYKHNSLTSNFLRFYSEEAKNPENEKSPKTKTKAQEETPGEASEEAPEITGQDENALKEELEAAKKDIANFKDLYVRSVADFRNLQESTKREIKKSKDLALKKFAGDLLQVSDTFELALKSLEGENKEARAQSQSDDMKNLVEGVEMTQKMFLDTLKRHGLEKMNPLGEKFDPNIHEAVFEVPQPDKEAGSVFFVQQAGYTLNGRVLRPAKVGVIKGEN